MNAMWWRGRDGEQVGGLVGGNRADGDQVGQLGRAVEGGPSGRATASSMRVIGEAASGCRAGILEVKTSSMPHSGWMRSGRPVFDLVEVLVSGGAGRHPSVARLQATTDARIAGSGRGEDRAPDEAARSDEREERSPERRGDGRRPRVPKRTPATKAPSAARRRRRDDVRRLIVQVGPSTGSTAPDRIGRRAVREEQERRGDDVGEEPCGAEHRRRTTRRSEP